MIKEVFLERLSLQNYRNFTDIALEFQKGVNIIIGLNGSGKTNILESISLLSPGRGLRSAKFDEIEQMESSQGWSSCFKLQSKLGKAEIISSYEKTSKRAGNNSTDRSANYSRKMLYNGSKISSTELTNLLHIVWLTPQMEGIFLDSSSVRRRFFDRMVFNFYPNHAKNIAKYEHYMRQRNKILSDGLYRSNDKQIWLSKLEQQMSESAYKIATARENTINDIQDMINEIKTDFPKAELELTELFESEEQWDGFEANYAQILQSNRQKDAYSGRTNFGTHKSDLLVKHQEKQQLAKNCSTGEQKSLLISITLASIEAILRYTKTSPILLLDELFVHLDEVKKNYLASYIWQTNLQTFITSTDIIGLEEFVSKAHIIKL